ncbi:acid protease [Dentipellis sp. KUC8613]|nr:acid protease [Dentipellis sp. KUC8613]
MSSGKAGSFLQFFPSSWSPLSLPIMRYTFTFDAFLAAVCLGLSAPASVWGIPFPRGHELPATHIDSTEASHHFANVSRRAPTQFTLPLTPLLTNTGREMGYVASVKIGSNPIPYRVLMDSGSSDFWLVSDTCPQLGGRLPIGRSTSRTVRPFDQRTYSAIYEDGSSVVGTMVTDTVYIEGRLLPQYPFGACNMLIGTPATSTYDGVMGFGFTESAQNEMATILDCLTKAGYLPNGMSGWKFSRNLDGRNDGEITFGGENFAKFFKERQVLVPNLSSGLGKKWEFNIDGISMDGLQVTRARVGIVDTGTSVLSVDEADAHAIHSPISGAVLLRDGSYGIPCSAQPKLSITINGRPFDVDPRDIIGDRITADICFSNIVPDKRRKAGEWLLGIAFLKNVYLTLDVAGNQMGFAELR